MLYIPELLPDEWSKREHAKLDTAQRGRWFDMLERQQDERDDLYALAYQEYDALGLEFLERCENLAERLRRQL